MMTYDTLSRSAGKYNSKNVSKSILVCQKSDNLKVRQRSKISLFKIMSGVVVKNVDNFFYLTKNHSKEIFHTKDDLVSESFIVLEGCLKNFDYKRGKTFLWYFNKALTRAMLRIIDKNYNKHIGVDCIGEKDNYIFSGMTNHLDFTDFSLEKLGITDPEKRIIYSKLEKEKVGDFLNRNSDITWNQYFKHLNVIKDKLKILRDE